MRYKIDKADPMFKDGRPALGGLHFYGHGLKEAVEIQQQVNGVNDLIRAHLWASMSEGERAEFRLRNEFPEYLDVLGADTIG